MIKKVCIYCASSPMIDAAFFDDAHVVATKLVENGISIQFGGGSTGLMGKLADTTLELGGEIIGIMPKFMQEIEWDHKGVSELILTETMAQRKERLIEGVDAVITLAGGSGTFEELFEVITLKRLGLFTKPIIILNTKKYYEPLKMLLQNAVEEKFMNPLHTEMWQFIDDPNDVVNAILSSRIWSEDAINYAAVK